MRSISNALRLLRSQPIKSIKVRHIQPDRPQLFLSIATVVKNEGPYLLEWLAFHRLMGVAHVVLYDNGSTDDTLAILRPFIDSGYVTFIPWPHFAPEFNTQMMAYAHAIGLLAEKSVWVGFLDVDEFLFSPTENTLSDVLGKFGDLPSVLVFRHSFGTSGHLVRPEGLVIETFTQRMLVSTGKLPMNGFLAPKPIVQPKRLTATRSPHYFLTDQPGILGHNERRLPIRKGDKVEFHTELLCINHYYTKDKETFAKRMTRATRVGGGATSSEIFAARFAEIERSPVLDVRIAKFIDATKEAMKRNGVGVINDSADQ